MAKSIRTSGVVLAAVLLVCSVMFASEPAGGKASGSPPSTPVAATTAASQPAADETPRLVPWVDYRGDLSQRAALLGDWGGTRQQLMDKGLKFEMSVTQIMQSNWAGGLKDGNNYQGNVRFGIQLDTGKAGLWPGGLMVVRGESRYGRSDITKTGALVPVNTATLFPEPERDVTALTDMYFVQFLSPTFAVTAGKMSPREANVFAHDETTQFMNAAFNFNLACITTVPLDFLAAGFIVRPTDWFMVTTLFLDSEGEANKSGFDTAFHEGMTVYQNAEVTIKPFDMIGHQRLAWTWSDKERIQFDQNARGILGDLVKWKLGLGPKPALATKDKDWSIMYDFDQFIYNLPGKPDKGLGVFGRFGVTSGEVNPVGTFYSIGIGGKGMIPGREDDTFGIGYYYLGLSDKLPRAIRHRTDDEQGVELYYNIAITPWLHLTPDLQIINPVLDRADTVVVGGIRLKIDF